MLSPPFSDNDAEGRQVLHKYAEHNPNLLVEVVRMINRRFPHVRLLFDMQARRAASAVVIQSSFRSYICRTRLLRSLLEMVCRMRASLVIKFWWRYTAYLRKRLRYVTILNRAVNAIDSKTVYMEADLFYFLTNEKHLYKMARTLEACDFHKVDFGFDENDNLRLVDHEDERSDAVATTRRNKQQNFQRRQSFWQTISPAEEMKVDHLPPYWMAWKPGSMNAKDAKLENKVGALLLTGAKLHLVSQTGKLRDPDVLSKGEVRRSVVLRGQEIRSLDASEIAKSGIMLMCMQFKNTLEAKRRVGMLLMKTFDPRQELYWYVLRKQRAEEEGSRVAKAKASQRCR